MQLNTTGTPFAKQRFTAARLRLKVRGRPGRIVALRRPRQPLRKPLARLPANSTAPCSSWCHPACLFAADRNLARNCAPGNRNDAVGHTDGLNHRRRHHCRCADNHGEAVGGAQVRVDQVVRIGVGDHGGDGVGARALSLARRPGDDAVGIDGRSAGRVDQGVTQRGVDIRSRTPCWSPSTASIR